MPADAPIPLAVNGLWLWSKSDAATDAIKSLNRLMALEIAFGGKRFPVQFSGENAIIDLKETIVSNTSSLPAIGAYTVLANPTNAGAAPVGTDSPVVTNLYFLSPSGSRIEGSGGDVVMHGNFRTLKAASAIFCSVESDSASYGSALGVFQNISSVRRFGGYMMAEQTTKNFVLVVRNNGSDTSALRFLNSDATADFLIATDSTSSVTGAVRVAGGLGVAKALFALSLNGDTAVIPGGTDGLRVGYACVFDAAGGNNVRYATNVYNSSGDKYLHAGGAAVAQLIGDNIYLRIAASGSANAAITWQEAITMVSGNRTLVGGATDDTSTRLQVNGGVTASSFLRVTPTTVSGLPSASVSGRIAFVTDAFLTAITGLGLTVTGSGGNFSPVYSDGTNWIQL